MTAREQRTLQGIKDSLFDFAELMQVPASAAATELLVLGLNSPHVSKEQDCGDSAMHDDRTLGLHLHPTVFANQKDRSKSTSTETGRQMMNQPPNWEHWFGTNSIGQDLWSRIWSGTRTSLLIALVVGIWEVGFGIAFGALWGYVRQLDVLITEIYNVINNIPTSIVMTLLAYIMRPSLTTMILTMCATGWLGMARFVRNQIVIIRDREYNLASRCLGTDVAHHLEKPPPHLVSSLCCALRSQSPNHRLEVSSRHWLGLPINTPSLGNLVNEAGGSSCRLLKIPAGLPRCGAVNHNDLIFRDGQRFLRRCRSS